VFRFTDLIIFQLTRDCNLKCEYCLMLEKHNYKGEIIDFELYKKIINVIVEQRLLNNKQNKLLNLNFHGGEITLVGARNFYKFVHYADSIFNKNKLRFTLGLQTNGILFNEDFIRIINKFGMSAGISIDGFGESNNLRLKNSEELYKKKFDELVKNHVNFGIMPVVHKKNINDIANFKEYAKKVAVNYSSNYVEDPYVNGIDSKYEISGNEYFKNAILPSLKIECSGLEDIEKNVAKYTNDCLYDIISYHLKSSTSGCWGKFCGAGISMMAVHPDGSMGYCDRWTKQTAESYIQNALDYDFLGIYQLKKTIDINIIKHKVIKKHNCDLCPAEFFCDYGCLSFYYSKHGNYDIDTDKVCNVSLAIFDYINNNFIDIAKNYAINKKAIKIYAGANFIAFKKDILKKLKEHNLCLVLNGPDIYFKFIGENNVGN